MADLKDLIRKQYGIDIKKDNIIKLYKINAVDISEKDLEAKISERRKKWNQSINGANEKFAERDRAYLEKADKYEAILRDSKLRTQLFEFYNGKKGNEEVEVTALVKKYFGLISATTKVGKSEVDFFLKYFPSEKKNKKSILEYLKKEYKVLITSLGEKNDDEEEEKDTPKKDSKFVVNLFDEKTLIKIRTCEIKFYEAKEMETVTEKYPAVKNSLYEYLQLGKYKKLDDFKEYVGTQRTEIYNVRSEFGADFVPLLDLFNGLNSVVECADVRDNFEEFKLLIMYPALTPYMYEIAEIRKDSLDALYNIASEEYSFRNITDFLVSYFNVVYDNFGIYEDSIKKIMQNAEKQAGKEKVLGTISSVIGLSKSTAIPKRLRAVYVLSYWPIHVLAFLFRIIKFVIEKLRYVGVGVGLLLVFYFVFNGKTVFRTNDVFTNGLPWLDYLAELNGLESTKFFAKVFSSIEAIVKIFFMYCSVGLFIGLFFWKISVNLRKIIDLKGIQRSIDVIIDSAKKRIIEQDKDYPEELMKKKMPLIISNFFVVIALAIIIILLV